MTPATLHPRPDADLRKGEEIAAYIRRNIISGAWKPEMKVPPRTWFIEKFDAASLTVQRAFTQVLDDGFLTSQPRVATRVAPTPPHLRRFALLLYGTPQTPSYHTRALIAAAAILRQRGYEIDEFFLLDADPGDADEYERVLHRLESHCYAGVFFESCTAWHAAIYRRLREIPMTGFLARTFPDDIMSNPNYLPLEPHTPELLVEREKIELRHLAESGVRKVAWAGCLYDPVTREKIIRETAIQLGMDCPDGAFLPLPSTESERMGPLYENMFRLLFSPANQDRPDGIIIQHEDLLPLLAKVLHHYYGDEARTQFKVRSVGNYPILPEVDLDVRFFGCDMLQSLENGLQALLARRQGKTSPPLPRYVCLDSLTP